MSWWSTARAVTDAFGVWERQVTPVGCALGRAVYAETKRAAQIANLHRRRRSLRPETQHRLRELFPRLDLADVRIRTRCRLPANRFQPTGSTYAMTFGSTIYWRDELDEARATHLVHLIHELVHVDQVRRFGGESTFACRYGTGYLDGGGELPAYIDAPNAYHRNPLESEAYNFESTFRDASGRVVASRLPGG